MCYTFDSLCLHYLPAINEQGADVNARDKIGMTPLMWSVMKDESGECLKVITWCIHLQASTNTNLFTYPYGHAALVKRRCRQDPQERQWQYCP